MRKFDSKRRQSQVASDKKKGTIFERMAKRIDTVREYARKQTSQAGTDENEDLSNQRGRQSRKTLKMINQANLNISEENTKAENNTAKYQIGRLSFLD